ncbi:hypothetical protein DFH05DRAFT_697168 [Lentinula detonsa]|uniref:HMG box domain-containing protein n=1 Tax=Lentinula detonsa TaxID=2804962 RepID=A0A9W8P9F2_9AGAR|nr:hypothetical protein DFH05DRAFT_697168 [Lentinula detonsa]
MAAQTLPMLPMLFLYQYCALDWISSQITIFVSYSMSEISASSSPRVQPQSTHPQSIPNTPDPSFKPRTLGEIIASEWEKLSEEAQNIERVNSRRKEREDEENYTEGRRRLQRFHSAAPGL